MSAANGPSTAATPAAPATPTPPGVRPRRARGGDGESARTALGIGYVVVAGLLATVAAWPVYASMRMLVVAAAGIVAGLGLAALARALPLRGVLRVLVVVVATAAAYALLVVPVAIPSAMTGLQPWLLGIRDGFVGVVVGWKQLLTLSLPLGEYQAVLVPFLIVMLVGTLVATLLVVPDRRSSPLAVIVGFAMSGFGLAFGSSTLSEPLVIGPVVVPAPRELLVGIGGLVAALVWLLLRSRSIRAVALRRATAGTVQRAGLSGWPAWRRRALAGVLVVLALVAGAVATPAAASLADRTALRDRVEPEVVVRQTASPLASYRAAFGADRVDEPWLELSGDTEGLQRLRLATLEDYDGETFHVATTGPSSQFSRLPRAAVRAPGDVALEVGVGDGYAGIWVPAPLGLRAAPDFGGSRQAALDDGFHRSADGATAISIAKIPDASGAPAGVTRGLAPGDGYDLVSAPDATTKLAEPGGTPQLDPEEYPALSAWLELQDQPSSAAGLTELVQRLRARGYLSHAAVDGPDAAGWIAGLGGGYSFLPSYSGHSKARIEALFTQLVDQQRLAGPKASDAALVAGVGDDEQFAVAIALIARALGYDSRVVLGFRLPDAGDVPGVATCTDVCTGGSLTAWTEVSGGDDVWVPIDATPQFEVAPSLIQEGEQLPQHPTTPDRPDTATVDPPSAQSESSDATAAPPADDPVVGSSVFAVLRWVALGLAVALCLVLPFLALLVAKGARTRRRRHDPVPELRVVGAWDELVDLYVDHGVIDAERAARADTARASGRPAAATLAVLVDRAVFAGDPPSTVDAEAAWAIVDAERRDLRAAARARRRLSARLSFASLVRPFRPARASLEEPAR
ncbi:transglutaminase-like domain-containing protein [Agromyces endophyticus]|uniref:transglutaminase-like domain-containing protein n=1 Tax=Agromyces sp. H17E-10 TaxID=2932244 RepID=UPI001FD460EC|nr:transglutaminase-like domain-containing protein [Agromyces sp. H17E-10]UOQ90830.1 transglutaminase-like domain-containing protein [Agromyces sp. H17E-10]